jgi:DNA-binding MarR family transcriptional regulator
MPSKSRETVGYLIRRTNIALSRALQRRLARYNLTSPQMIFMREIWLEEGLSQRELSERVGAAESTTASALRVLERRKLIRRIAKAHDRRAIHVYLTAIGRRLEQKVMSKIHEVNDRAVAGVSRRDLAMLNATLRRIRDNAIGIARALSRPAARRSRGKRRRGVASA